MTYFTLRDLSQSALALVLFFFLFFPSGYLLCWAASVAGFRRASWPERVSWSVPVSLATVPVLTVFAGSLGGLWFAVVCCALLAIAAAALIAWEWRKGALRFRNQFDRYTRLALLAVLLWCAAALLQLVDLQWGHSLLVSVTVRDHSYRTAFIEAVLRSGVPPTNPLYLAGHAAPMRNYYFWYVVCAVLCKATLIPARNVLVASCAWAAIALFCTAALFCKYFLPRGAALRRTALLSILLFGVTGLDLIMVVYLHLTPIHRFDGDMEWWDVDHWPSFLDNFLYVPHHVASLVCCLVTLPLLWTARGSLERGTRWLTVTIAAAAFASAFGLSIYVAFAFAVAMLVWCVALLVDKQYGLVRMIVAGGALAAVLLLPFLLQLRSETASSGEKQHFPLRFQLRELYGQQEWAEALTHHHTRFYAHHLSLVKSVLWAVLLLPDLTIELGLYGLVLVLAVREWRRGRYRSEPGMRALLALIAGSLFATLAIRSSVIAAINDYGFRTAMIPLFLLLVVMAHFLAEGLVSLKRQPRSRPEGARFPLPVRLAALVFLLMGAAATLYQAVGVRFYLALYEHGRLRDHRTNAAFPEMGQHVYELRQAYDALGRIAPARATVQYNPMTIGDYFFWINMINAGHQIITAEPGCGKSFGGDEKACPLIEDAVNALYLDPAPTGDAAMQICRGLGIDYLVATDQDPAWQDSASWVWSGEPSVAEPDVRILRCR